MARRFRAEVQGLPELKRALRALPDELRQGALRGGVDDAADVLLGQAELNVPKGATLQLMGSLAAVPVRKPRKPSEVRTTVGTTKEGYYGAFIEYGTSKMPARPWLRPALHAAAPRAIAAATDRVRRSFETDGPVKP